MRPQITLIPVPPATRISADIPGSYVHDCYLMPLAHSDRHGRRRMRRTTAADFSLLISWLAGGMPLA